MNKRTKFSGLKSHGNRDITSFICPMTSCFHVTNELCDFVDNIFSSEATSLSSLVVIGLVEVEYNFFHFSRD